MSVSIFNGDLVANYLFTWKPFSVAAHAFNPKAQNVDLGTESLRLFSSSLFSFLFMISRHINNDSLNHLPEHNEIMCIGETSQDAFPK